MAPSNPPKLKNLDDDAPMALGDEYGKQNGETIDGYPFELEVVGSTEAAPVAPEEAL